MNYETAIELAHQRMREIGKRRSEYHIEPVSIVGTRAQQKEGEIVIKAYNEYYYLVNYQIYYGFSIISDTGYFNADDYTQNTYQEFTGLIRIIKNNKFWNVNAANVQLANKQSYTTITQELEMIRTQTVRAIDFIKVTIH
ncbi:MAG: hypothetical protein Q8M29_04905 [Bacteroidota bacterium]|nr:hypothetical protein [Bacteroidota bacterium]